MLPVLLGLVVHATSFEQLVAEAQKTNTPLVVDVFTTWCEPCKRLEKNVLRSPRVVEGMRWARLVRLDAEGDGAAVAERFNVHDFPTVLVLSPDGVRVGDIASQDVDGFLRELNELRALATARLPAGASAAGPRELYLAALREQQSGPSSGEAALALLDRARAADRGNATGVGERAAWDALPLRAQLAEHRGRRDALLDFMRAFPLSPRSVTCLQALGAERPVDAGLLSRAAALLVFAATQAKDTSQVSELIPVLLSLRLTSEALLAADGLVAISPKDTSALDTAAEAHFLAGQRDRAVGLEHQSLALEPTNPDHAARLERYMAEAPRLPESEDPELFGGGPKKAPEEDDELKKLVSTALAASCGDKAQGASGAWVRLYFDDTKPLRVVSFDPDSPKALHQCLQAAGAKLPLKVHGIPAVDVRVRFGEPGR